jgi:hypothetical protein
MTVRTCSWRRTSAAWLHAGMIGGREQEAEAGLVEQLRALVGAQLDLRAERFEHVGRAAARADAAVAVLGDRQAAGGGDEGGRGRDVDQARAVAAGAAAIGEQIIGPLERQRGGEQAARGADHLLGGLALHPQRDQHAGDLGRLQPAEHQPLEQMLGIVDRKILAGQQLGQGVGPLTARPAAPALGAADGVKQYDVIILGAGAAGPDGGAGRRAARADACC